MSYSHFQKTDRVELSILLQKGYSYRSIALAIKKSVSAISREVSENSTNGIYDPAKAERKARLKRRMSKYQGMKIADNRTLEIKVAVGWMANWSPEEVTGRIQHLNSGATAISAKSIYKFCYSNRGQYLCKYLPHKRYHPKQRVAAKPAKTLIPTAFPLICVRRKLVSETLKATQAELETASENS